MRARAAFPIEPHAAPLAPQRGAGGVRRREAVWRPAHHAERRVSVQASILEMSVGPPVAVDAATRGETLHVRCTIESPRDAANQRDEEG